MLCIDDMHAFGVIEIREFKSRKQNRKNIFFIALLQRNSEKQTVFRVPYLCEDKVHWVQVLMPIEGFSGRQKQI